MDVDVNGEGKIYDYVLFTNNNNIDARDDANTDTVESAAKTEGFVGSKANEEAYSTTETSTADKYYTFNLEVKKVVDGDSYIKTTKHNAAQKQRAAQII